ncbi:FAD-binding oxidoreductase [Pseudaminobacter sp. 19-2017]|uniref:FAD-binding oxidoreductase n=1 Tax=Pseudaminobacter soli (ex Zhang et al. 2022) TaxID=2831468 RepID=A0A942E5T5_9HYPH|nr:FAD-binding oxidoreductase [Pseudaminobacter soli]MBS3648987.1 FAD-binding oxidoreductase [Pseudaminobacter soli]
MSDRTHIAVIGAGIVGICTGANLAEAGFQVTVYDRTGVCEETSSGNAAALAFPDPLPLSHKGMLKKLPGWLADPLGPLTIPPAYLPKLMPWLIRFMRAGHPSKFEASLNAQAGLMRLAESEWAGLSERADAAGMISHNGAIDLYESEAELKASLPGWEARERLGIPFEHVSGARLAELQPGLSPRFTHGTFMPTWKQVDDPKLFGKAIWAYAERLGARFERRLFEGAEIARKDAGRSEVRLRFADGSTSTADSLVICAGAWSHFHAAKFGDRVPLETERGYNTTLPVGAFDLRRQLTFVGHGFVVSPLVTGVRVGGAVELAGLKRPPNYARARAMLEKAKQFLPGLKTEGGREWMGYRPSLPDSLPVIGRARSAPNVFYAFGHGHLGLTQSAATGRLIRDLATGKTTAVDLAPFSPQRF